MRTRDFDVAVVGGGPAGLSCALWLGRYQRSTVLIDAGDPRNWETAGVNGYLGLPKVRPADLRRRGRTECKRYKVRLIDALVNTVARRDSERFDLELKDGPNLSAKRLVLAIGLQDVWPDVPGLDHCYGLSAHHCPDCDGFETIGKKTIVIGQGKKAVSLALALSNWAGDLVICTNGKPANIQKDLLAKLDALNIPVIQTPVRMTHSENRMLTYLELENGMHLDGEKLFFAVEHLPADDLGAQLGCDRDEDGLILVDETKRTSVENVFAVGDITPGPQIAIRAAADGAIAAAGIHRSLLPEVRRL
jgi:thioredoxin reductase